MKNFWVDEVIVAIKNLKIAITDLTDDPDQFAFNHPEFARQIRETDFANVFGQLQRMSARKASAIIPQPIIDQVDRLIMDTYENVLEIKHEFVEEWETYDEKLWFNMVFPAGTKWDAISAGDDRFYERFYAEVAREYRKLINVNFYFKEG